jgi:DNA-binding MarR family transcriptional regulator
MMNYRSLLLRLDATQMGEYTSSDLASLLRKSVKEVSNDLRRLYRMGFLRRKRTKRFCLSRKGEPCYKGREYIYSFSEQGRRYMVWMKDQRPIEDLAQIKLGEEILSYLPEELRNKLLAVVAVRSSYRYSGPNRHFRLIDNEALPIANLNLQNQKLREEKRNLSLENDALTLLFAYHKGFSEGLIEIIKEYRRREEELTKSVFVLLPKMLRLLDLYGGVMEILQMVIKCQSESRDLMLCSLRSLPKEKFSQAYQLIVDFEKVWWVDVERKKEALKVILDKKEL